jgi:FtsP/CotA-like multicopper oxidase with cupredoxin domain
VDTVLIRTGQSVDLLFDVTNAGSRLTHRHLSEHHHSGMMITSTATTAATA